VNDKRLQALENQFDAQQAELQHLRGPAASDLPSSLKVIHLKSGAQGAGPALPTQVRVRELDEAALAHLEELLGNGFPTAANSYGPGSGGAPDALFDAAFDKLKTGDLVGAATEFQSFADRYPNNTAADNALLDEGIAVYGQHRYAEALRILSHIEARYPAGDAVPEALWRAADCDERLGQPAEARKRLQHLAQDFPASPEGARAVERLRALAGKPGSAADTHPPTSSIADSRQGGSP
jgi:TolA-binding protein